MSITISDRPASSFSWADDEDDDFDFESWKATADTTAPTAADLGPLQFPTEEDIHNDFAAIDSSTSSSIYGEDQAPTLPEFKEPIWWQVKQAQNILTKRALQDHKADVPAYHEMSAEFGVRYQYSYSWLKMKANSGLDCRKPVQFLFTPLSQVGFVNEEVVDRGLDVEQNEYDQEIALEAQAQEGMDDNECLSEVSLEDLLRGEEYIGDVVASTTTAGDHRKEKERIQEDGAIALGLHEEVTARSSNTTDEAQFPFSDILADSSELTIPDEGYESSSPPVSPTFTNYEAEIDPSTTVCVVRKHIERKDSMDVQHRLGEDISANDSVDTAIAYGMDLATLEGYRKVDIAKDGPLEAIDRSSHPQSPSSPPPVPSEPEMDTSEIESPITATNAPSTLVHPSSQQTTVTLPPPDLKYTTPDPTRSQYLTGTLCTSWFLFSHIPWTKFAVLAASTAVTIANDLVRGR